MDCTLPSRRYRYKRKDIASGKILCLHLGVMKGGLIGDKLYHSGLYIGFMRSFYARQRTMTVLSWRINECLGKQHIAQRLLCSVTMVARDTEEGLELLCLSISWLICLSHLQLSPQATVSLSGALGTSSQSNYPNSSYPGTIQ
jgi:hypothetical protein